MTTRERRWRRLLSAFVVALLVFPPFSPPVIAGGAAMDRVATLQAGGQHARALEALDRADASEIGPLRARGVIDGLRGASLLALGRLDAAEAAFRASIARAETAGDEGTAISSRINLASALAARAGDPSAARSAARSAALEELEAAHAAAIRLGAPIRALLAATKALEVAAQTADRAAVERWRARALASEPSTPATSDAALIRARLAAALLDRPDVAFIGVTAMLDRAEATAPEAATAAALLAERATLALRAGDREAALDLLDRAALRAAGVDEAMRARAHWRAGRIRADLGRSAAIDDYRRAVAAIVGLRRQGVFPSGDFGPASPLDVELVFREALALLLGAADSADGAAREAILQEVRTSVEQLRSFEIERYFADDCVARLRAAATAIETVSPDTAVLYVLLTPARAYALLSLDGRLRHRRLEPGAATLEATAVAFRRGLETRTGHRYVPDARRLYDWIVRPWRGALDAAGVDTIVFIGDGALRNAPPAAFLDGDRFLVEDFALATAPGLSLVDPRPFAGDRRLRFLLAALSEGRPGFAPLPHTLDEVAAIEDLFGGVVLADEAFSLGALAREIERSPFSVVHIASHGVFAGASAESFILAGDGRLSLDALDRLLAVARYRETPVELLTLSACQTAAGDSRAALGLAGVAVKAGARSALASLWSVNDESSAELLTAFYAELARGDVGRAEALRRAQIAQRASPRFGHPAYWAAFVMIGNWL